MFIIYFIYYDILELCLINDTAIDSVNTMLTERFRLKDLGQIKQYLGIPIQRDQNKKIIYLIQENINLN